MNPEDAFAVLLASAGEDPSREGLADTPARAARAFAELTSGYKQDPDALLRTVFHERCDEMVVVDGIDFISLCEHHLLPFSGKAVVAYVPQHGRVAGLSKIPRVVHAFARRLQVQERMTQQIAEALQRNLNPAGVAVIVRSSHLCMKARGVRCNGSMTTSAMIGCFRDSPAARSEIMGLAARSLHNGG